MMHGTPPTIPASRAQLLTAAPHRTFFFAGLLTLLVATAWWGLHIYARQSGAPVFALLVQPAPIWSHAFLMLFAAFPTIFFGFLYTVFPRWMNGPLVSRAEYVGTAALFVAGTLTWLTGTHIGGPLMLVGCGFIGAALVLALVALFRVLLASQAVVAHAVVVLIALCVQLVALAGFAAGIAWGNDFALHFAVRTSLWGGLLPVFFAVCHRMVPFFSMGAVPGYEPWRPTWVLAGVVGLCYARLLLGTASALAWLPLVDAALLVLTAWCGVRWTSLRSRGNALLWTLYAGYWWLPVAVLLQLVRDGSFVLTGEWALGRAPVHALGMGFYGSMVVAMVTRVTMGHSGRPLRMDRVTLACFLVLGLGAFVRIAGEVLAGPAAVQWSLLASVALWLGALATWFAHVGGIYLAPRIDGRPG